MPTYLNITLLGATDHQHDHVVAKEVGGRSTNSQTEPNVRELTFTLNSPLTQEGLEFLRQRIVAALDDKDLQVEARYSVWANNEDDAPVESFNAGVRKQEDAIAPSDPRTDVEPSDSLKRYLSVSLSGSGKYDFDNDSIVEGEVGGERIGSGMGFGARDIEFVVQEAHTVDSLKALRQRIVDALGGEIEVGLEYTVWKNEDDDDPIEEIDVDADEEGDE